MNIIINGSPFEKKRLLSYFILTILLVAGACAGWFLMHRPITVAKDIYPYLTSLPYDLVVQSQEEGRTIAPDAWAAILSVRSTLNEKEAQAIVNQLREANTQTATQSANTCAAVLAELINKLPAELRAATLRRYQILISHPYYEPDRYAFPCPSDVWFEDTFGANREGGKRTHQGTDIFAPEGTAIYSVCDGKIEQLGWNRLGGERVGIRGFDGNYYYYAHLQAIAPELEKGMAVKKGQKLGTMGHTGDALTTPDHLHFGIQLPSQEWIDPYPFLKVWFSR